MHSSLRPLAKLSLWVISHRSVRHEGFRDRINHRPFHLGSRFTASGSVVIATQARSDYGLCPSWSFAANRLGPKPDSSASCRWQSKASPLVLVDVSGQVECRNVPKHLARLYTPDPRLFWVTVHYKTLVFGAHLNFVDHSISDRQLSPAERKAKATVYSSQEYDACIDTVDTDDSCQWEPCYNCASRKHVMDDCKEPLKVILKYCSVCRLNGHTTGDCLYAVRRSSVLTQQSNSTGIVLRLGQDGEDKMSVVKIR